MAYSITSGQVSSGIILNNDSMYVYYSGTAVDTTLNHGNLDVFSGGTANSTVIIDGGYLIVSSGGMANSTTIYSGGMSVSSGGMVNATTVEGNFYGAGFLHVFNGGTANNTMVAYWGSMHVSSGGKVTGSLITSGAVVSAFEGSIINFDISTRNADSPALVNDLSLISGTPNYTITVSAYKEPGVYTLAHGAEGVTGTFTIGTDGSNYGTVTVNGDALSYGDYAYTLATADSDLLLTVAKPVDPYIVSGLVLINYSYNVSSGYTVLDTQVNSGGILNVLDGGTANDTILNSKGFTNVSAGGTAHGIIINGTNDYSYPTWYCYQDGLTVFAGGQVSDVTLNSGRMVNDGGTVRNVTVESGLFTIDGYSDTALTENITVNDGGIISFFMNPGRVNGVTVNSGGAVSYDTPANGGFRFDGPGSVANITVNCGGKFMGFSFSGESVLIEDMARISNAIVSAGDFASVIRNQIADGISIENGGSLSVWDGAKAVDVTVKSGGSLDISTGGKFANITVEAVSKFNGFTFNESAVIADPAHVQFNHVSVESEGYETATIARNQTATDVTVKSDGSLYVEKGGAADNVTVKSGAGMEVREGAIATNITVEAGGTINGFSFTDTVQIADWSEFSVSNAFADGWWAYVYAGQTVTDVTVNGNMEVEAGGTADHITVKSDGGLSISSGAQVSNITVEAGGGINGFRLAESAAIEDASHFHLSNLTVDAYSYNASVYAGQTVTNVAANSYMNVYSGGTAVDVTVSGSYNQMTVYSGGTVDHITVKSGADLWAREGASATNITVEAGGKINGFSFSDTVQIADWSEFSVSNAFADGWWAHVYAGQTVTDVTVSGGMEVDDGGTAENIAVNEYGSLVVYDGGTAANITVRNNGSLTVNDGADVSSVTVEAGGEINGFTFGEETVTFENEFHFANAQISQYRAYVYRNETASDITVSGTTLYVSDGGYASDITVKDAGVLSVEGDGSVSDVTVKSGGKLEIKDAASATHITVEAGGSINGFTFGDGTVVIEDASVLSGLTVSSDVQVSGFQTVTDLTVEPGGSINGFIFGNETVAVKNASQLSGVTVKTDAFVYENQSVTNVNVGVGGSINGFRFWSEDPVEDASHLSNVYIVDYVVADVYAGQTVTNITDRGLENELTVHQGGTIGGDLSYAGRITVKAGGIIDFTVAGRTPEDGCLINLSQIDGSPTYTITVAADQAEGVYALAGGADGFSEIATICVEGVGSDSLTVGETVTLDGRDYTLNLDASLLTLSVSGGAPVGGTAGDLNADGRADIIMTIDQGGHPADGSTGAWLIQDDQTAAWGDLSMRNAGWEIFGTGKTAAGKNTDDVYIRSESNIVGAWTTGNDGQVTGWETVGEFDAETQIVGLGDFNGNGQTDLLLRNNNGAVGCFFTGGEKTGWNYFQSLGDEWKLSAVGDLNGDGRDDVVLKHNAGFAGSWLTQKDGTMAWADLDTVADGFEIVGAGDFNADGTDDVLLKNGNYYGAWLVNNGNAAGWMGLGDLGNVTVEQIADFNGDGVDDLRIRTAAGDIGAQLVMGADTLEWKYYGSVGGEWKTALAALG